MKIIYIPIIYAITSSLSYGCSCVVSKLEDKLIKSQSVYSGYFTKAEVLNKEYNFTDYTEIEAQLKVVEVFKGKKAKYITLNTPLTNGACGMPITIGKKYLIIINDSGNLENVHVDLCSGSGEFPDYYEDKFREMLEELRKGEKL